MKFTFITDTHFTSSSNVRAGDYLKDLVDKLAWVVDRTNELEARLLLAGDVFDKPSVPDCVKTQVIRQLKRLDRVPMTCIGNHDRLYNSDERFERTSLSVLEEAGCLDVLQAGDRYLIDGTVVSSKLPLKSDEDHLQILLWHGFLNKEDGLNTIKFTDLLCDTPAVVLLGHDHCEYEPMEYRGCKIYRPGSFARGVRNDSAERIPQMLLIDEEGNVTSEPIGVAKQVEFLFKSKVSKVSKSQVSYEDIINQIKSSAKTGDNLTEALKLVTDNPDVIDYIDNAIELYNQSKNK